MKQVNTVLPSCSLFPTNNFAFLQLFPQFSLIYFPTFDFVFVLIFSYILIVCLLSFILLRCPLQLSCLFYTQSSTDCTPNLFLKCSILNLFWLLLSSIPDILFYSLDSTSVLFGCDPCSGIHISVFSYI